MTHSYIEHIRRRRFGTSTFGQVAVGKTLSHKFRDISDASEHFSSSDDLEETLDLIQIPKCEGYFEDVVRQMPDNVYFDHFRMSRQKTEYLAKKFAVSQYFSAGREGDSEKISALQFITVFLWYA
ncbi:unnamed protein product [Acanthoscelides obtectus]|uniref:Uncharacterized protein n=1 Tax=Acanthoscelides obtectus TaxID=200917 RepID=A0A9P0KJK0_ACAOB|nr:unnamed protein product [Acanthoscelides obtectus]CAK1649308.1 hypothetical protein AOBTE_LOCUS16145 [Acanthoscelides obtectus]